MTFGIGVFSTVVAKENFNFDGVRPFNGAITQDGQLIIGSASGQHLRAGLLASADGSVDFTFGPGTIDLSVDQSTLVNMSPYIVGATTSDFTTIQAAITQAVADGASATNPKTILIKPGTYAENLTMADGIWLIGQSYAVVKSTAPAGSFPPMQPAISINGVHSIPTGISCSFVGVRFINNLTTDLFSITGSTGRCIVGFSGCYLVPTSGVALHCTTTSVLSSFFYFNNCQCICTNGFMTDTNTVQQVIYFNNCGVKQGSTSNFVQFGLQFNNCTVEGGLWTQSASGAASSFTAIESLLAVTNVTINSTSASVADFTDCQIISGTHTGASGSIFTYINCMSNVATSGAGTFNTTNNLDTGTNPNVTTSRNASAANLTWSWINQNNSSGTVGSRAVVQCGGSSAGDAFYSAIVNGVTTWSWGADNSDSDAFVLSASATLGTTNVMRASTTGAINKPLQPCFSAYLSGNPTNVTGDGTLYVIAYDSVNYDQGSNFNTTTHAFVAPVTGKYLFTGMTYTQSLGVAHTVYNILIQNLTSGFNYYLWSLNPQVQAVSGVYLNNFSNMISCAAGDNVVISLQISGSTKTIGILGGAAVTLFEGFLVA